MEILAVHLYKILLKLLFDARLSPITDPCTFQINARDNDDFTPIHQLCDAADRGGGIRTLVLKMMLDTGELAACN